MVLKDLSEGMSGDLKEEKERTLQQSGITKSRQRIQGDGSASARSLKWQQAEGVSGIARKPVQLREVNS